MLLEGRAPAVRDGMVAAAPLLVGIVPFALVAGAAPAAAGFELVDALGLSAIVFAGASQLALIDVLDDGGIWVIAAVTALSINLRMLLYSASLARPLAHLPTRQRLLAAYFLVDQTYALAIVRWDGEDDPGDRLPFYLGAGVLLGSAWLTGTAVGVLVGSSVPDEIPLDFTVPLVFLVLLVPVLTTPAARWAAGVGGIGAVVAAELGADRLSILAGGLAGIIAGTVAETVAERRAARGHLPEGGPTGDTERRASGDE